jgi:hypothetical protein
MVKSAVANNFMQWLGRSHALFCITDSIARVRRLLLPLLLLLPMLLPMLLLLLPRLFRSPQLLPCVGRGDRELAAPGLLRRQHGVAIAAPACC